MFADLPEGSPRKTYKVIGIVGSRRRNTVQDYQKLLNQFLKISKPSDRIVSGGCPTGADNWAELIAKEMQRTITIHYAQWTRQGKGAGMIRNSYIAEDCDVLIALPAAGKELGYAEVLESHQPQLIDPADKKEILAKPKTVKAVKKKNG